MPSHSAWLRPGGHPSPVRLSPPQRARVPNLIVIGASKSGTTSLHAYLDAHPEIAMSRQKELNFFGRAENLARLPWYLEQFDPAFEVRGESSPSYSQYPRLVGQPDRIRWLNPEMRLIYLVRDPIPRAIAHWAQQVSAGTETRSAADAFADLDATRNLYVCASSYATQLEDYLRCFPPAQILVIDQYELRHRRRETLRDVFTFLGVDDRFWSPTFEREVNRRRDQRRLTNLGETLRRSSAASAMREMPQGVRRGVGGVAKRMLSRRVKRPDIGADFRMRLERVLAPEVERLRELTGRGFETWSI